MKIGFNEANDRFCKDHSVMMDLEYCEKYGFDFIDIQSECLNRDLEAGKITLEEMGEWFKNHHLKMLSYNALCFFNMKQTQAEKDPEQIKIQVKGKIRTLALRKPGWAKEDLEICVQGNQADPIVDESGYIRIQADFEAGVEINVRFPYHPGLIRTPDKPELAAVQAGPYILAALSEEQEALQVPVDEENVETLLQRAEEGVEYFLGNIRFIPLYRIDQERYHVYLHTEK